MLRRKWRRVCYVRDAHTLEHTTMKPRIEAMVRTCTSHLRFANASSKSEELLQGLLPTYLPTYLPTEPTYLPTYLPSLVGEVLPRLDAAGDEGEVPDAGPDPLLDVDLVVHLGAAQDFIFHEYEYLQEASFVLTDISENLWKPLGFYGRM